MKTFFTFLTLFLLSGLLFSQEWTVTEIGTCPKDKAYGICLGDGHNDGTNRLYVSTRGEATDGSIYEWTYSSGTWTMTATIESGLGNLVTLAMGEGRNDGVNRLYAVEWYGTNSKIYEYTWSGTAWNRVIVANIAKPMLSVIIGDARGDGIKKIYVAGWIVQREYIWNGSSWDYTDISTAHGTEGPSFFGIGRNDNILRYYTAGNHIKEFTWDGTTWSDSSSLTATTTWPETVVVTDGRNDGVQRIYTQDGNSGTYEVTRNGASWSSVLINPQMGRSFLFSAKTKSDGKNYLYCTDANNGLAFREYAYNSGTSVYDVTTIDAATGATALIDAGAGRNDNIVRIYTPGYASGKIYEITNQNPYTLTTPPEITGDDILCPDGTGMASTGLFDRYQWYVRQYEDIEATPITGAVGQAVTMDFNNYAATYLSVEVFFGVHSFLSDEFFVDGWAFLPPTVMSTGNFTVGPEGESVICNGEEMYFTLNDPYNTNIVWYKDGNPIPGETEQTLTITEPGTYSVEGAPSECPTYVQNVGVPLVVILCTSANNSDLNQNANVMTYPNPVADRLHFYPENKFSNSNYTLTSITGKNIRKGKTSDDATIDFTGLNNGVYFIRFDANPEQSFRICKTDR